MINNGHLTYIELNRLAIKDLISIKNEEMKRIEENEGARQMLIQGILFLQTVQDQRSK